MDSINNEQNRNNSDDFWQAEVLGQIYDTNFNEMTQWIAEGALMPSDKVRRGNLRWLDAGKVPSLLPFFNLKELGIEPPPIRMNVINAGQQTENFPSADQNFQPAENFEQQGEIKDQSEFSFNELNNEELKDIPAAPIEGNCLLHDDAEAKFHCDTCFNLFCPACPKSYGGSVKICPMCGALLKPIAGEIYKKERESEYRHLMTEGFGFKDFGRALAHPFKFKISLVVGAIMFMIFTIAQSASSFGSFFLIGGAIISFMLANMLAFGVLANTIENFSQGKLGADFMPKFDDFNLWDDVVHPFFLAIGVYISSFGAFFLVIVIGILLIVNSVSSNLGQAENLKQQTVPPLMIDQQKSLSQSDEVKKLLENAQKEAIEKRALTEKGLSDLDSGQQFSEEEEFAEIEKMIQENRKDQLESVVGKTPETQEKEFGELISNFKKIGIPILILAFVTFLWGVFYMPAACAVAGYTRSFTAAVNPSVGIDTIKHLGIDYLKIFGMYLLLLAAAFVIGAIFGFILQPFDMPAVGNLPAKAISSLFTFYFTIVFSCILGYALFKNSDKFKFYRG